MSVTVFSKNWYRVEFLKPRLKVQVDVASQVHRGDRWFVLRDTISGNVQRYSWQAYQLIGLMDGDHSLHQLWEQSADALEQDMPTQDEVISLVAGLYQADMVHLNVTPNVRDLFQRQQSKADKKLLSRVQSPLSIQLPLLDPTAILDRLCPYLDRLLTWKMALLYLVVVIWAAVVGLQHFDALTSNLSDRVLAAENLLLIWVLYPVIKIVHELGHAYAVRRYGGQVSEVGIMFLVFFPMPYVNATESASFSSKYQRMWVSAAGIVVELFIAALALLLWSVTEPGLLKSILFNVVFMAGVSTLLFNGNPLLKFDAYYFLSDWLEIPNLAKKSTSYWGYLCKRYLFAIRDSISPSVDNRERYWLFFYNLFSFAYRLFISISIILFVGSKYYFVGVVLAIWAFTSGWLIPFGKTFSKPFREFEFRTGERNPILVMGLGAAVFWALLFELPLPRTVTTEGVTWVNEAHRLYAGESGFIEKQFRENTDEVATDDVLVSLKNYELEGRVGVLRAQITEARARFQSLYEDPAKFLLANEEIKRLETELKETTDNLVQARVVSRSDGQFILARHNRLREQYLAKGDLLGYVIEQDTPMLIRVLLPESQVEQIVSQLQNVSVRTASHRDMATSAELLSITPQITQVLPSMVLSQQAGGQIVMDPASDSIDGQPQSLENFIEVQVRVPDWPLSYIEERAFVQFDLAAEPIFWRLYRMVRRAFLEQFDV